MLLTESDGVPSALPMGSELTLMWTLRMGVFRIGMGYRSPLRKHSGMGCQGGVGGRHVSATWKSEKYVDGSLDWDCGESA